MGNRDGLFGSVQDEPIDGLSVPPICRTLKGIVYFISRPRIPPPSCPSSLNAIYSALFPVLP